MSEDLQDIIQAQARILEVLEQISATDPDRPPSFGEKMADVVVSSIGSWKFLIIQSTCLVAWICYNTYILCTGAFDPYPYILLNLILSFQAAFASPLILMAQNRSDQKDRRRAIDAYNTVLKIEKMLEELYNKIERKKNGN